MKLTPRLICRDADAAIAFYKKVLGAELLERHDIEGTVVLAMLKLGDDVFAVTEEARDSGNDAPPSLGGSTVIMMVEVPDPDAIEGAAKAAGGEVIYAVDDRFYGRRDGRFRDPFGHLWLVGRPLGD